MHNISRVLALGSLTLGAMASCASAATVTSDLEYGQAGGESLKLDACVPEGEGPFPAVILVHGGGWSGGDKADKVAGVHPLFEPLTKAGIAWFSVNYRLAPAHRYPACVEDVEAAVRWVGANAAKFKVDPKRLALLGESAGGHIVDMVAVRATADRPETRVAAIVVFYAPCDNVADTVRRNGPSPSMQNLLGVPPGLPLSADTEKKLRDISPLNFVHQGLPPYLLVHGTADQSVPHGQSVQWQAKLKEFGVPCELVTVENAPHGMARWEAIDPTYKEKTVAWLLRALAPAAPAAPKPAPTEPQKITALLDYVEKLPGATFIRNGSNHTPKDAAGHLRDKLKAAGNGIRTARAFIAEIASRSSLSGDVYKVRLADGTTVNAGDLLTKELQRLETANAK